MALAHLTDPLFLHIAAQYGESRAQEILSVRDRSVTLRVNALRADAEEIVRVLSAAGIACRNVDWYQDALIADAAEETIEELPIYREGKIYLQSLSSMLPPLYLAPAEGESVLDMTAAPGGKTCELYALSRGRALITACERDRVRFERLKFNLNRQGCSRVTALHMDALRLDDAFRFDKILLDAPCTGSGTATASAPIRFSGEYMRKCAAMQEKLLLKALKLLKKGGKLVYSTCSILREENEEIVQKALAKGEGKALPAEPFSSLPALRSKVGFTVLPTSLYEGFFVSVITK